MPQNETQRHFKLRDLDTAMKKASGEVAQPISASEARAAKADNLKMLAALLLLVGLVSFVFSIV